MAQAPTIQSVMPEVAQEYSRVSAATPDAFGAQVGEAQQRLGNQLVSTGDKLFAAAVDFQKRQDDADVDHIYSNVFSPAFRTLYSKYYALQGKRAVDELPAYFVGMEKLQEDTLKMLPNERQKHLFNNFARRRVEMEKDAMGRRAEQQNQVYQLETFKSVLDNLSREAGDNYSNDGMFASSVNSMAVAIDQYATTHGKSAEWARDALFESTSNATLARLNRMIIESPLEAQKLYDRDHGVIDPNKKAEVLHKIKTAVLPIELAGIADRAISPELNTTVRNAISISGVTAPQINTALQHSRSVAQAIFGQESGEGRANTAFFNSQGVTGPMQIKDTTFQMLKDRGIIPKDYVITNPEQNKDAGFRYVDWLYNKYAGDAAKVAAAYYGGEGAVNADGTINRHWKNLQRPSDPTVGQYIDQVLGRIKPSQADEGTAQQVQSVRDIRAMYADAMKKTDAEAERLRPGDALYRKQARAETTLRLESVAKAQQGFQNQAFGKALEILAGRNGGEPPMTWEAFYAAPGAREIVPLLNENGFMAVQSAIERNAKRGEERPSRINAQLTQNLYSQIVDGSITDASQIYAKVADGLNPHSADYLVKTFNDSQKPGGLKYGNMVDQAGKKATRILMGDFIIAAGHKDKIPGAVSAFMMDLDSRIKQEEAKTGGDPRSLVDPTSKNNMLRPEILKQYVPGNITNLSQAATKVAPEAAKIIEQGVVPIKNEAEYAALKPGTRFKGPDGKERIKP
tara:strand:- start:3476 stop:5698 length:2223 start_codon:yes stop_codon:yes gene_type:complete